MTKINVVCAKCGLSFLRPLNRYNEAIKFNREQFCSDNCRFAQHNTSIKKGCDTCGKEIVVQQSRLINYKHHFCCHSCAATHVNLHRCPLTEETKNKIAESLNKYYKTNFTHKNPNRLPPRLRLCSWCNDNIARSNKAWQFCSNECKTAFLDNKSYTKEQVIEEIQKLHLQLNATPSSKLNKTLANAAKRHFKLWNKAIEAAGLEKNTEWMARKPYKCCDGHLADSLSEMLLDNWFNENGIKHERFRSYPEGKYNCDFFLPESSLFVEYFGLIGHESYDLSVEKKRDIAKRYNIKLIEIVPDMLYPTILLQSNMFK